jgi:DNA-binding PadR family transcriptional regulator
MPALQVVKLLGARRAWKLFKLSRVAKSFDAQSLQELRTEAIRTWEDGGRDAVYALYEKGVRALADWLQAQADRGESKDRAVAPSGTGSGTGTKTGTETDSQAQPRTVVAGRTTGTRLSQRRAELRDVM